MIIGSYCDSFTCIPINNILFDFNYKTLFSTKIDHKALETGVLNKCFKGGQAILKESVLYKQKRVESGGCSSVRNTATG